MDIQIVGIIVTIIIAAGAWYANNKLNPIALLKTIINVLIVLLALYFFWQYLGVREHTIHTK